MIIGKIHPGSGLGDQLFSYITTRTIALDKGYEFGFVGKEFFKGKDFMNLDWGKEPEGKEYLPYYIEGLSGKLVFSDPMVEKHAVFEINKPYYDPEVNFIEDGTVIDGCSAQDERYWGHRLNEIREWLRVEPLEMGDDLCVINFRGGEYATVSELFLPKEYWESAMDKVADTDYLIDFQVETDDTQLASQFFPEFPIRRDIALNWRALRYAKNAIVSNSAFAIIPRLLKHSEKHGVGVTYETFGTDKDSNGRSISAMKVTDDAVTIAPRFWAGRNVREWRRPQNYYKKFKYI